MAHIRERCGQQLDRIRGYSAPGYGDAIKAMLADVEHDHWRDIHTPVPASLTGAITGWTPCRERAVRGKLTPAPAVTG
jgi:hypothetical protein